MIDLLKKIGLADAVIMEMNISQSDFLDAMSQNIDPPGFDLFEMFSSNGNHYKGTVTMDSFDIKRKKTFGNGGVTTHISGSVTTVKNGLLIDMEISTFHEFFIVFLILIPIGYIVLITSFFFGDQVGMDSFIFIPFLLVHAAFMLGVPYFIMRKRLKEAKHEIERDIFFMMKDKLSRS